MLWEPEWDGAAATSSLLKIMLLPLLLKPKPVQYSPGKEKLLKNIGTWPLTALHGKTGKGLNWLLMTEEMPLYCAFTVWRSRNNTLKLDNYLNHQEEIRKMNITCSKLSMTVFWRIKTFSANWPKIWEGFLNKRPPVLLGFTNSNLRENWSVHSLTLMTVLLNLNLITFMDVNIP